MTDSIVFVSRTGNTKLLADTICRSLPREDLVYFGEPCPQALEAQRIFVGFWTDKGSCPGEIRDFLETVRDREVFLFGTAGFGGDPAYFEKILATAEARLQPGVREIGSYMCVGKMPMSVRERYEKLAKAHVPKMDQMIENFDKALFHPDDRDLKALAEKIASL